MLRHVVRGSIVAIALAACNGSTQPGSINAVLQLAPTSPVPAAGATIDLQVMNTGTNTIEVLCAGLRLDQRQANQWVVVFDFGASLQLCASRGTAVMPGATTRFTVQLPTPLPSGEYRLRQLLLPQGGPTTAATEGIVGFAVP